MGKWVQSKLEKDASKGRAPDSDYDDEFDEDEYDLIKSVITKVAIGVSIICALALTIPPLLLYQATQRTTPFRFPPFLSIKT